MFATFVLAAALASAAPESSSLDPIRGYASVTDGDTIRLGRVRVRLHGVNAAEMNTLEGQEARRHLVAVIGRQPVECRPTGQKSYDRIVAICYGGDNGSDLGGRMVQDGWARDWQKYSGGRYVLAEIRARLAGRGMHGRR